jgi:hypothetical protein
LVLALSSGSIPHNSQLNGFDTKASVSVEGSAHYELNFFSLAKSDLVLGEKKTIVVLE